MGFSTAGFVRWKSGRAGIAANWNEVLLQTGTKRWRGTDVPRCGSAGSSVGYRYGDADLRGPQGYKALWLFLQRRDALSYFIEYMFRGTAVVGCHYCLEEPVGV